MTVNADTPAEKIAVHYYAGQYRIHGENCRDRAREREPRAAFLYAPGTTLQAIAAKEYADFIDEDPDYYTPEVVLAEFTVNTRVLPCAEALLGH